MNAATTTNNSISLQIFRTNFFLSLNLLFFLEQNSCCDCATKINALIVKSRFKKPCSVNGKSAAAATVLILKSGFKFWCESTLISICFLFKVLCTQAAHILLLYYLRLHKFSALKTTTKHDQQGETYNQSKTNALVLYYPNQHRQFTIFPLHLRTNFKLMVLAEYRSANLMFFQDTRYDRSI